MGNRDEKHPNGKCFLLSHMRSIVVYGHGNSLRTTASMTHTM